MAERYASRGRTMAAKQRQQAWLPQGCQIPDNLVAPPAALWSATRPARPDADFFTPGVLFEFKQMVREQIMPRLSRRWRKRLDDRAALLLHLRHLGIRPLGLAGCGPWPLRHRAELPLVHAALIEFKLIGHAASAADMDAAEARLLGRLRPWLVGRGNEAPASQILAPAGRGRCTWREGESRGALLAMCHFHPWLEAHFSLQPPRRPDAAGGARRALSSP